MSFPSISIIILNYNAKDFIENCIRSILESEYTREKMEIILVDNASSDKSVEIVRNKFPPVKIVQNKSNLGFCEGNNVGMRTAEGEILVILNPDVKVEKNWLIELIKVFEQNNNAGLVRSKLLYSDGTIQNIGFKLHKSLRPIPIA